MSNASAPKTPTKIRRKEWAYTVEKMNGVDSWFIGGLDGYTSFHSEADAKLVVDALNCTRQMRQLKRKTEAAQDALQEFNGRWE